MFTKAFFKDLVERSVWTFVQSFAGFFLATKDLSTTALVAAAGAAGIAVIKCLAATQVGDPESAAMLPNSYRGEPLDAGEHA